MDVQRLRHHLDLEARDLRQPHRTPLERPFRRFMQTKSGRSKPFKPRCRNERVGVLTPSAQFLSLLPKFSMTLGLQATGEPLHK